ncbi:MAG: murein biosynthesis integral membrane protein MurJ, partial [Cellulosilyticaceae bacterium]
ASKFLGLLRDMVLAAYLPTAELTAFLAASKIPLMLFDITIGGVISAAFIPVFNSLLMKENKEKALKFANEYINFIIIITSVLTVIGILGADGLIGFTLSGDEIAPETRLLAVELSRIMFGMIIFTGVAYSFVGMLNSNGQFYITSILSLISNGLIIGYLMVSGSGVSVHGLAGVMLLGWSMQVMMQIPSIWKYGYRFRPTFKVLTPEMKSAMVLSVPILISSWAQPLSSLINMKMASYLNGGDAVVALEMSNRLYVVIAGIFGYVISNLSYPYLSKVGILEDTTAIKNLLRTLVKSITFIITPIMVGLVLLALPIVSLAYERGEFTAEVTLLTATALMTAGLGMLAFSYNEILNKTFYAMNNSKIPMYTATTGIGVNVVLSMVLPQYLGIAGLGLAIATGTMVTATLNFTMINRKLKGFFGREGWVEVLKIAVAALVMAAVVVPLRQQFDHVFLQVLIPTCVGAVVYMGLCLLFRVSIVMMLLDFIMTKLKKGGNDGK